MASFSVVRGQVFRVLSICLVTVPDICSSGSMLNSEGSVSDPVVPLALKPEEWNTLYLRERGRPKRRSRNWKANSRHRKPVPRNGGRSRSGSAATSTSLSIVFKSNCEKPASARADLKELRRSGITKNMRRLEKEAARLQGLLNVSVIDSGRHSFTGSRKEISRLKAEIARQAEELKELGATRSSSRRVRPVRRRRSGARARRRRRPGTAEHRGTGWSAKARDSRPAASRARLFVLRPSLREEQQP